jgi:hypothetical protein
MPSFALDAVVHLSPVLLIDEDDGDEFGGR